MFSKCLKKLQESFGPPGQPGKPIEIKKSIDNLVTVCDNLIDFEKELLCLSPPEKLIKVKSKIKGSSKSLIIDPLKNLECRLKEVIDQIDGKIDGKDKVSITLTPVIPKEVLSIVDDYREYFGL